MRCTSILCAYWRKYSLLDVIISFLCSVFSILNCSFCLLTKRAEKKNRQERKQKLAHPLIKKIAPEKHIQNKRMQKDVESAAKKIWLFENSLKGFITRTRFTLYVTAWQAWWGKLKSTFQQIWAKGKEFNCKDCAHRPTHKYSFKCIAMQKDAFPLHSLQPAIPWFRS